MIPQIIFFIIFALLIAYFSFLIIPLVRGAPYVPTHQAIVEEMASSTSQNPNNKIGHPFLFGKLPASEIKMADLGSGDGRIVIEFAKQGIESHGYEINPLLALLAKWKIAKNNLTDIAFIHTKNLWNEDLAKFDLITVFGATYMMVKLREKLKKELNSHAIVISCVFPIPTWTPQTISKHFYVYQMAQQPL